MSDIVERLRDGEPGSMWDGAREILRLRAENEKLHSQAAMNGKLLTENAELREVNEKLRAALKLIAETYNKPTTSKDGLAFIAAATLKEQSDE